MIIGIDNDKLKFIADSNGKLVVTLENLTDAIVKKELLQNCVITRCKDCKHQRKEYREDKRRKEGGYNIYWCELVDGYAPLGFDDEYCAWAERKEE